MNKPFQIFSWRRPFLPDLKDWIMGITAGKPGSALIIVPNQRPWRYFEELFARDKKTVMLPKMLPFANMISMWRRHCDPRAVYAANTLDQVALAWDCVKKLAETDRVLAARLAKMDLARFLPWGIRLANLLEDIFTQGLEGRDVASPEGDVEEFAASLLQSLSKISALWKTMLPERGFTTPGLDCFIAGAHADNIPPFMQPGPDRPVFAAGFSTLNGIQKKIFRSLWQEGAIFCLHGDPELALGGSVDWACAEQAAWIKGWGAVAELATPEGTNKPEYSFYAAYDSHSQLLQMISDFKNESESAAIVLQDTNLLMPVLHHLEDKNVNISMGYPLSLTPLHSLITEIFDLLLRKRPEGRFYWRDLLRFIHHPLLATLGNEEANLRKAIDILDRDLRNGTKFVDINQLEQNCREEIAAPEGALLQACLETLLGKPEKTQTPLELANALEGICDFLLRNGAEALKKFPLDEEALARLRDTAISVLAQNALAEQKFSLATLHGLLSILTNQERIPFEADPLVSTQILGMLETRLLHFNELFILDASDDFLPGQSTQDPLLPDNLRGMVGLPDSRARQKVAAHNLFRLCQSAKRVHFYWTEGSVPSGMETARKSRSRFIERIIWGIEQTNGHTLEPGNGPLKTANSQAILRNASPSPITRTKPIAENVKALLQRGISAALLNDYLACPLKFAKKRLLRIMPQEEVQEDDDPALLGDCVHKALCQLLKPYVGKFPFTRQNSQAICEKISEVLDSQISSLHLRDKLPVGSFLYFDTAAPGILKAYIQKEAETNSGALLVALEKGVEADIKIARRRYRFYGKIDRIDERDGFKLILDYKTGARKKIERNIWLNQEFFSELKEACVNDEDLLLRGNTLLQTLRENCPDIQLPLYMLVAAETGINAVNAAFVYLREKGCEEMIFKKETDMDAATENCRTLIGFLLRHMELWPQFEPVAESCKICEYLKFCGV